MRSILRAALVLVGVAAAGAWAQGTVGQYSIGILGGPIKMAGDNVDYSTVEQWVGISTRYTLTDRIALGVEGAGGWVRTWNGTGSMFNSGNSLPFKTNLIAITGNIYYYPFQSQRFAPFVNGGAGFIFWDVRDLRGTSVSTFANGRRIRSRLSPALSGALGVDYHLSERIALTGLARLHGILKGRQDTSGLNKIKNTDPIQLQAYINQKDANFLVVEGQLGVRYFFGGQPRAQTPDEDLFGQEGMSPFDTESDQDAAFGDDTQPDPFGAGSGSAESGGVAGGEPPDMEEYIRLKSLADELTQGIELKEREISSLQETLSDRALRLQSLQSGSANGGLSAGRSAPPLGGTPATAAKGSSASFSLAYEQGLSLLTAKRYQEAIEVFAMLVSRFPTHALASHCHYWSGEAYFNLGSYQAAIESFNQVLRASLSLKKDNALLMLGRSYLQLNRTDEARRVFNQLIQEYPSSEFVGTAEEMLAKL